MNLFGSMCLSFTSQIWNPKATNKRKSPHILVTQKNTKILILMNIVFVMSNRDKTVISCTLYINNILCVRVD